MHDAEYEYLEELKKFQNGNSTEDAVDVKHKIYVQKHAIWQKYFHTHEDELLTNPLE